MLAVKLGTVFCQLMGFISFYPGAESYSKRWWFNTWWKLNVFSCLLTAFYLQYGNLKTILDSDAFVVTFKNVVESIIFWSTLYVSSASWIYHSHIIDKIILYSAKKKKTISEKLIWNEIGRLLTFTTIQFIYYGTTVPDYRISYIITTIGFFLNRFYVNSTNIVISFAIRWMAEQFFNINETLLNVQASVKKSRKPLLASVRKIIKVTRLDWQLTSSTLETVNNIASPHIWLFLSLNVVEYICSLNQLLIIISHCNNDMQCIIYDTLTSLAWFFVYFISEINFINACNTLHKQIETTKQRITEFELLSARTDLETDLTLFRDEIHYRELAINAGGCYKISNRLLMSNAQVVLTYVMIQLQFESIGIKTYYSGYV